MPTMRDTFRTGEIVIELAGEKCQNFIFRPLPTGEPLRGRWDPAKVRGPLNLASDYKLITFPIPGTMVAIDPKARTLRGVDPLTFTENADMWRTIQAACKGGPGSQGDVKQWDGVSLTMLSPSEIKTALWHIREFVRAKKAVSVKGDIPKLADILAMEGQLLLRDPTARDWDEQTEKPKPRQATERELERIAAAE